MGAIYFEVLPIILPSLIEQLPKTLLLKILSVLSVAILLLILVSIALYLKLRKKLISQFGILWDKNKEPYCPACEIILSEYHEQNAPPIYEFRCIKCNAHIRLMNFGKSISLSDAQKFLK